MSKTEVKKVEIVPDLSDETPAAKSCWYSAIFRLRIEEFIALVFFFPMLYFTAKAYMYFKSQGDVPNVFVGDVQRVFGIIIAVIITLLITRYRPGWTFLRDSLPFAFCIAIYTNLHDTIHFANPNDIHHYLIAIDQWMFGAQPAVWAERFIHPVLTEIFSFCYMIFFAFGPAVALTLYLQKRKTEFRAVMVSVVLCFYAGYLLYVLFPAVPPRITLQHLFTIKFNGTPLADTAIAMINVLPRESRAAFPSLHAAVTLLSLVLAYKYVRWLFWILLPFCTGLLLSTVYLRHHYVIDLIAGFILSILALIYGPRVDAWWNSRRLKV
ncbi:MAG: inositol phosphorylceramide synthase [Candidatus Zixiibacteriota bacterium]|nr:MAG: inositol phosphorylceramide synthase [candidate division Zixibacteria bacterium]